MAMRPRFDMGGMTSEEATAARLAALGRGPQGLTGVGTGESQDVERALQDLEAKRSYLGAGFRPGMTDPEMNRAILQRTSGAVRQAAGPDMTPGGLERARQRLAQQAARPMLGGDVDRLTAFDPYSVAGSVRTPLGRMGVSALAATRPEDIQRLAPHLSLLNPQTQQAIRQNWPEFIETSFTGQPSFNQPRSMTPRGAPVVPQGWKPVEMAHKGRFFDLGKGTLKAALGQMGGLQKSDWGYAAPQAMQYVPGVGLVAPKSTWMPRRDVGGFDKALGTALTVASFVPGLQFLAPVAATYNVGTALSRGDIAGAIAGAAGGVGGIAGAAGTAAQAAGQAGRAAQMAKLANIARGVSGAAGVARGIQTRNPLAVAGSLAGTGAAGAQALGMPGAAQTLGTLGSAIGKAGMLNTIAGNPLGITPRALPTPGRPRPMSPQEAMRSYREAAGQPTAVAGPVSLAAGQYRRPMSMMGFRGLRGL